MNKEHRKKLAGMILEKSRLISAQPKLTFFKGAFQIAGVPGYIDDIVIDSKIIRYFEKIGFEKAKEGWEVEENTPWQATPPGEGPHLLFKPDGNHLYFGVTTPLVADSVTVMKIDMETAEKILVLGLP